MRSEVEETLKVLLNKNCNSQSLPTKGSGRQKEKPDNNLLKDNDGPLHNILNEGIRLETGSFSVNDFPVKIFV